MLALEGINILDLSGAGPGPFCTMILGDLGAEVIRVEPTPTSGQRQVGIGRSSTNKRTALYQVIHRNKKSLALNLKTEAGRDIFYKLAGTADAIVETFRPGVAKRLGVDYAAIAERNPRIIYCSISGYGQDGPYRELSGHDINYVSLAGMLDLIGEQNGRPVLPLNVIGDFGGGGMSAAVGILSALIARGKTGKGQYLDISCTDCVATLMPRLTSHYFQYGEVPKRGQMLYGGGYPYLAVYETKDGGFLTIACIELVFWERLCRELGKEEFIPFHYEEDHFFKPPEGKIWQDITACLKQTFLTRTRDEWFDLLSKQDIPVAKVYSMDEAFADPHMLQRKMVIEFEHPAEGKIKQVGIAIKLSDTPGQVRSLAPVLGEHTDEVLRAAGYSKPKIAQLRREEIIC